MTRYEAREALTAPSGSGTLSDSLLIARWQENMSPMRPALQRIDSSAVQSQLRTPFGQRFLHVHSCESTNDVLWTEICSGAPPGTVVITDRQTRGRGRRGRRWESTLGKDLLFSVAVPILQRETSGLLAIWASVAAADTLIHSGLDVEIKWPNDLFARGRKLGGVLVETRSGTETAVLGMGINVLSMPEDRPHSIQDKAVSLLELTQQEWDRNHLLADLLNSLGQWHEILEAKGWQPICARWRELCPMDGRMVLVRHGKNSIVGLAENTDPIGSLTLRDVDGKKLELANAEIRELVLLDERPQNVGTQSD